MARTLTSENLERQIEDKIWSNFFTCTLPPPIEQKFIFLRIIPYGLVSRGTKISFSSVPLSVL